MPYHVAPGSSSYEEWLAKQQMLPSSELPIYMGRQPICAYVFTDAEGRAKTVMWFEGHVNLPNSVHVTGIHGTPETEVVSYFPIPEMFVN